MPDAKSFPAAAFAGIVDFTSFLGEIWCAAAKKLLLFAFGLIRYPLLFLWRLALYACRSLSASLKSSLGDNRYFSGRILRALKALAVALFSSPKSVPALFAYYTARARLRYRRPVQYLILLLLPLAAGAMLAVTVHHYGDLRLGLQVSAGDTVLGCVTDENVFLSAKKETEAMLSPEGGGTQWPQLRYSLRLITANAFTDEETLKERLLETAETKTIPACGVYIDGDFLCAVKNENDAKAVFTDLLYENAPAEDAATVGFIQRVEYVEGAYPATEEALWTKAQLRDYLTSLQGEEALHVTVTHTETKTVAVPFGTQEIQSDALYIGTSRVVVSGRKGTDQVTSLVTLVDGEPIRSQELLRYTLQEPVDAQVQVGTRALDASFVRSTSYGGVLIWPAIGATHINSDYAWRWGKLHAALDIGSSVGTSMGKLVVAAAEGTVIAAGPHGSYGYYVKIDHGNGMQTLYAHCMAGSLMVNPGDHVDAGAPIARIGMTGYATGPHLHFEVIINGNKVDPKPYLGIG